MAGNLDSRSRGRVLNPAIQSVLQKLRGAFGPSLVIHSVAGDTMTFSVRNMTSEVLIRRLEMQQEEIFGKNLDSYQVLASLLHAHGGTVELRYLPGVKEQRQYAAGFWYY